MEIIVDLYTVKFNILDRSNGLLAVNHSLTFPTPASLAKQIQAAVQRARRPHAPSYSEIPADGVDKGESADKGDIQPHAPSNAENSAEEEWEKEKITQNPQFAEPPSRKSPTLTRPFFKLWLILPSKFE